MNLNKYVYDIPMSPSCINSIILFISFRSNCKWSQSPPADFSKSLPRVLRGICAKKRKSTQFLPKPTTYWTHVTVGVWTRRTERFCYWHER